MINYYLITKPGIIFGNIITFAAGFFLASKGQMHYGVFFAALIGLTLIMASACVFNNIIDKQLDKKMKRTQRRPLVQGIISSQNAATFATILATIGSLTLILFTNLLTTIIAGVGFFVYVILYSLWKGRTVYGTAIGSIAGAVPPVIGYCAVSNRIDAGAIILFAMMVLWQMPHFYAIAMYHFNDYARAKIPVLPIERGAYVTKFHMLAYISAFIPTAIMLTVLQYTGNLYLMAALILGIIWLALSLLGFKGDNDRKWARQMFHFSLVVILSLCLVIPFDGT